MTRQTRRLALAGLLLLLAGAAALWVWGEREPAPGRANLAIAEDRSKLGLMTSLPIYWGEVGGVEDILAGAGEAGDPHWVRSALETEYRLVPLDTLAGGDGGIAGDLAALDYLLLAQPYTLTPAENVALDMWLRDGGRLLMFADPVLTEHSRFALGDRRRPQDIGLVSGVFARWGLAQSYDEGQPAGLTDLRTGKLTVPVHRRGQFALLPEPPETGDRCFVGSAKLIAKCRIGEGHALIVADAAMLEQPVTPVRSAAFKGLLETAFAR
ncbi:MAG: ABC transporter [Alteripontixanthobacter sp.]